MLEIIVGNIKCFQSTWSQKVVQGNEDDEQPIFDPIWQNSKFQRICSGANFGIRFSASYASGHN